MAVKVKVDDLIMWPGIEALEYGECNDPCSVLGPKVADATHIFVGAFFPKADEVKVKLAATGRSYELEKITKSGYYAAIVPAKGLPKTKAARAKLAPYELPDYKFIVKKGKTTSEYIDPYRIESQIDAMDQNLFNNGLHKNLSSILGANIKTIDGVKGTQFAVWAPGARAVSVVGPFNDWNTKSHPMRFLEDSGIYELFIPGIEEGEKYQFRLLDYTGKEVYKSDPYGKYFDLRPEYSSIVYEEKEYKWSDSEWMKGRVNYNAHDDAMVVYSFSMEGFVKPEPLSKQTMQLDFHDYRTIADDVSEYCKNMGYTHAEILPILEYPIDNSLGYQTTGYYAPTSRFGKPEDFKYFVDTFHKKGIGVIVNWTPCYFPRDAYGLTEFDGTCLYEHLDPRKGIHPHLGTKLFNYTRNEVTNFLIGSAMYLIKEFHIDGLQINDLGPMLYCDWGRRDGEWIGNIYGGNENLEGKEFLQLLNNTIHEEMKGVFTIGHDSVVYPGLSDPTEDGGVGFDLIWNEGWKYDFLDYMRTDPLFRKGRHNTLTLSMAYQYAAEFLLGIGYNDVTGDRGTMFNQMAGMRHQKFASLRLVYGFQLAHPGKVLNFAGTETGELDPWYLGAPLYRHREKTDLKTGILPQGWKVTDEREEHKKLSVFVSFANSFYRSHSAMFADDDKPAGFEWIDALDADRSSLVFLRKSKDETLLVVCNFTPVPYDKVRIGVPFAGKYREIFNSDAEEFGGFGFGNPRVKVSKKVKQHDRANSIEIRMAPMAIHIFSCEKA
ncbi:MAG: 1,4-alpha-glucan branching protein GlgB [Eubacterium sp.]|nr:1,4-alpha-glucan branching protein GlgB [Eubacterium sp.]